MTHSEQRPDVPSYAKRPGGRRRRLWRAMGGRLFPALHRFLATAATVEKCFHPQTKLLLDSNEPVIFAWWHESVLALLLEGAPPERTTFLISPSEDGKILARSAIGLGYQVIQGSSRLSGASAMTAMLAELANNRNILITPDGPLGPACKAKPGVAKLSALSGKAVIPVSAALSRQKRLKNWDRLIIPLRPSTLTICYHAPVVVGETDWSDCLESISASLSAAGELSAEELLSLRC